MREKERGKVRNMGWGRKKGEEGRRRRKREDLAVNVSFFAVISCSKTVKHYFKE
jgi:hypothetical protein